MDEFHVETEKMRGTVLNELNELVEEIDKVFPIGIHFSKENIEFFLLQHRLIEIFESIKVCIESRLYNSASILVRSMSDVFIQLKMLATEPNSQEIYRLTSMAEAKGWNNKIILYFHHLENSKFFNYPRTKNHHLDLKEKFQQELGSFSKRQTLQLFSDLDEMDIYLMIYSYGNLFTHTNLQTFNSIINENKRIFPNHLQDYTEPLQSIGSCTSLLLLRSYLFLGKVANLNIEKIEKMLIPFYKS